MAEMIYPKVCAVCGQVLDQIDNKWAHGRELAGQSDHVAVPVDYDAVPVTIRCDFCYEVVKIEDLFTLPAKDFRERITGHWSRGGWATCPSCAKLLEADDWSGVVERHLSSPETMVTISGPAYRDFLDLLYGQLRHHMTGPVRPWRAGDEKVHESPEEGQ